MAGIVRLVKLVVSLIWRLVLRLLPTLISLVLWLLRWAIRLVSLSVVSTIMGRRRSLDIIATYWTGRVLRTLPWDTERAYRLSYRLAEATLVVGWIVAGLTIFLLLRMIL